MKVTISIEADELGNLTIERHALRPPPPPLHVDPDGPEHYKALRHALSKLLDHTYAQVCDGYRLVDL